MTTPNPTPSANCGGHPAFDGSTKYFKYATLYDNDCCYFGPARPDGEFSVEYDCDGVGKIACVKGNFTFPPGQPYGQFSGGRVVSATNMDQFGFDPDCCNADGSANYVVLSDSIDCPITPTPTPTPCLLYKDITFVFSACHGCDQSKYNFYVGVLTENGETGSVWDDSQEVFIETVNLNSLNDVDASGNIIGVAPNVVTESPYFCELENNKCCVSYCPDILSIQVVTVPGIVLEQLKPKISKDCMLLPVKLDCIFKTQFFDRLCHSDPTRYLAFQDGVCVGTGTLDSAFDMGMGEGVVSVDVCCNFDPPTEEDWPTSKDPTPLPTATTIGQTPTPTVTQTPAHNPSTPTPTVTQTPAHNPSTPTPTVTQTPAHNPSTPTPTKTPGPPKYAPPTRIIFKNYTQLEWYDSNPILAVGEAGYENDAGGLKFGDGATHWRELPYSCRRGLDDSCGISPTSTPLVT